MAKQSENKILAILLTYQAEAWLKVSLSALENMRDLVDIALVDNNSSDNTRILVERDHAETITYAYFLNENIGFGGAHNTVLQDERLPDYDYVLLLNQDAEISPEDLTALIKALENYPEFGILSPMQYFSQERLDYNFSTYMQEYELDELSKEPQKVRFANAAIWLVRMDVFRAIGGFHPAFQHYGEDANFVHRAQAAGFSIGVLPSARGFHYRNQSKAKDDKSLFPRRMYVMALARKLNPGLSVTKSITHNLIDYWNIFMRLLRNRSSTKLFREHFKYLLLILFRGNIWQQKKTLRVYDKRANDMLATKYRGKTQ